MPQVRPKMLRLQRNSVCGASLGAGAGLVHTLAPSHGGAEGQAFAVPAQATSTVRPAAPARPVPAVGPAASPAAAGSAQASARSGAALALSATVVAGVRRRAPRRGAAARNSILKGLKDLVANVMAKILGPGEQQKTTGVLKGLDSISGQRIVVSSTLTVGQPFCGEYEELPYGLNERTMYRKLGLQQSTQAVYLLYNAAKQWAFTPHHDGRADGWAFAADAAATPTEIKSEFTVWDGSAWIPDPTLRVLGPATAAAAVAVTAAAAASGSHAGQQQTQIQQKEDAAAVAAEHYDAVRLPDETEHLSLLHWKAQWRAATRCLVQWPEPPPGLGDKTLPVHPGIRRGVLPNGMRYVILRNAMPPQRFEAHIELHVGSIDEEANEQGIAHMMEHVCFLGSRKRERLIGTGARSNALTDFQHTIYHIHAPVKLEDGRQMFLPTLEALHEIAFAPEMLQHRIEKERKAVLAEMQQVNDMEYRIETWTLSGLHETNKLGTQFPIGKEEQIKGWQQKDLKHFHEKWYYPGNATLYVVGDIDEEEMISGIKKVFEPAPARHEPSPGVATLEPIWGEGSNDPRALYRRRIARPRPEQLHNFSLPMIGTEDVFTEAAAFDYSTGERPWHGPVLIFRNELLEGLQMNFYAKSPVRPLRALEDIRHLIAVRILIGVLQFRIVSRYSSNHAPVQIDHSDSFREGCAVTSITVNADPRDWRNALACVVQEVRALCDHGITEGEMTRYMDAMLKDVEKGIAENDTVPSEDHLNFIMTSDVFDHVIMHPEQSYEAFKQAAPHVTMEQVHMVAKWVLGFLGYYGKSAAPPPTAIVVCTPTQIYEEHSGQLVPFSITEQEIVDLLVTVPDKSKKDALNQVEVPKSLLKDHLDRLLGANPIDAATAWRATSRKVDEATGIVQLLLPNGAKVNYACTSNESQGTMRILVPGGKTADQVGEIGSAMVGIRTISESGAVSDYSREQIELFAVSNLMSVHLDLNAEFCYIDSTFTNTSEGRQSVLELLHLLFQEPRWELPAFIRAQQAYKASAYAVQKSLEQSNMDRLMRMMYPDGRFSEPRIEDLNKLSMSKVRQAVAKQLRPQDLEVNLVADFEGRNLHKMAGVEGALSTGKHRHEEGEAPDKEEEVPAVAKERRLRELDISLWTYLGSVPPTPVDQGDISNAPVIINGKALSPEDRQRSAHLEDSDERAVANIGGGAPNRWGLGDRHHHEMMKEKGFSWHATDSPVKDHPLYPSMCLLALREVMNTRLFSTVRDSLGLSYDCSFDLSLLDRLEAGWYTCTVSAHPSKIGQAIDAAKGVIQGVRRRPISEHELSTAKRTLMRRHETDLQTNEYWIQLLSHLQYNNPKDISCIRDIESMFSRLTWRDVQNAHTSLLTDPDELFVSVTTAGPGASYVSGGAAPAAVSTSGATRQLVSID